MATQAAISPLVLQLILHSWAVLPKRHQGALFAICTLLLHSRVGDIVALCLHAKPLTFSCWLAFLARSCFQGVQHLHGHKSKEGHGKGAQILSPNSYAIIMICPPQGP